MCVCSHHSNWQSENLDKKWEGCIVRGGPVLVRMNGAPLHLFPQPKCLMELLRLTMQHVPPPPSWFHWEKEGDWRLDDGTMRLSSATAWKVG